MAYLPQLHHSQGVTGLSGVVTGNFILAFLSYSTRATDMSDITVTDTSSPEMNTADCNSKNP